MIGASKILTVSYGTFSCTLEGFDDPFNTMRAIAEYFRDLAAEDRYFGAEPPTPDAAMLHKIAEREVQRRVEAKIQDNSVILRTGDAMQAPASMPAQPSQPAYMPASQPSQQPSWEPPASTVEAPAPMPEGVAAKLLRIRAAVANAELAEPRPEAAPVVTPTPAAPILADYSEDQHADDIVTASTLTATFTPDAFAAEPAAADVWLQDDIAGPDADEDTAEPAETATEMLAAEMWFDDAAPSEPAPAIAVEAVEPDAELARASDADDTLLAALNGTAFAPDATAADPVHPDETADHPAPTDYTVADEDIDDLRALDGLLMDADANDAASDLTAEADFSDLDDVTAEDQMAETAEALPEAESEFEPEGDTAGDLEFEFNTRSDIALDAGQENATETDDAVETPIDPMLEEIDSVYGPDTAPTAGPSEKALRARARVIKVRRDDAVADSDAMTAAPEGPATSGLASEDTTALAAEAEADLRRELRALQSQAAPEIAPTPVDDGDTDETGPEDDARQRLDPAAGEAAVSRLIEQTNEAMAVPENRRRLSAIAHLKAAVAATVADRFSKGGSAPKEAETKRLDPYREDLARVVRPQHPTSAEDAQPTQRPAPLVLVSAQRIDRPRPAPGDATPMLSAVPNAPVRPRRVTSTALAVDQMPEIDDEDEDIDAAALFTDTRGFAEFSERLGANSLAEILEAAAAYSVCIEGRPYFSRPQLMGQIGALSADSEYTREDGLRTFGALLREGRIKKIKRGQFVLTESSRYLAEARNLSA